MNSILAEAIATTLSPTKVYEPFENKEFLILSLSISLERCKPAFIQSTSLHKGITTLYTKGIIQMEYIGFADAIKFVEISGISKNDLEKHVYSHKEFQERCMYRFGKNHKRYIKIRPAIDFIEQNLLVSETAL